MNLAADQNTAFLPALLLVSGRAGSAFYLCGSTASCPLPAHAHLRIAGSGLEHTRNYKLTGDSCLPAFFYAVPARVP